MRRRRVLSVLIATIVGATTLFGSTMPVSAESDVLPEYVNPFRPQEGASPFLSRPLPAAPAPTGGTCDQISAQIAATPAAKRKSGNTVCVGTSIPGALPNSTRAAVNAPICEWAHAHPRDAFYINRRDACMARHTYVAVLDPNTGVMLGRTDFVMEVYLSMGESNAITTTLSISQITPTPYMRGTTLTPHVFCQEACDGPYIDAPAWQRFNALDTARGTATFRTPLQPPSGQGSTTFTTTIWGLQFKVPGVPLSDVYWEPYNPYSPWARCDNLMPGLSVVGCVVYDYTTWLGYSLSGPYPELAEHIIQGQNSGLPGAPGTVPLTRIWTGDDSRDNRTAACPRTFTRPSGRSCDEYPFASSDEGSRNGVGGRTLNWCSIPQLPIGQTGPGFSACMIIASQNSGGGAVLGQFYRQNRVHQGDKYWVQISP